MKLTKNRICFAGSWVITGIALRFFIGPTKGILGLIIFLLAVLVNWFFVIAVVAFIDAYAEDAAHRIKNK